MTPLSDNPKVWKALIVMFLTITICFSVLFYFRTIFITIIIGIVLIALAEKPLAVLRRQSSKHKWPDWLFKIVALVVVAAGASIIIFLLSISLESLDIALSGADGNGVQTVEAYQEHVAPYIPDYIQERLVAEETITKVEQRLVRMFTGFFSNISSFIVNSALIIPLLFYMYYKRRKRITDSVKERVPKRFQTGYLNAVRDINKELGDFLNAKVAESAIIAVILCTGYYFAGVPGWFLLGVLGGFLNIVPYVGPIIGLIPAVVIALLAVNPVAGLYVIITMVIAQLVDNFYLNPFMISGKVRIDPLVSIILILVGAQLLGIMGMIFAIPIFLVYKIILRESYEELVRIYR